MVARGCACVGRLGYTALTTVGLRLSDKLVVYIWLGPSVQRLGAGLLVVLLAAKALAHPANV